MDANQAKLENLFTLKRFTLTYFLKKQFHFQALRYAPGNLMLCQCMSRNICFEMGLCEVQF